MERQIAAEIANQLVEPQTEDCSRWYANQTTSGALDFRKDRLVKYDVAETHGGEAVDFKEVHEIAAAALVNAAVDAICNSRGAFAQLLCFVT
eukprot:3021860-Pleurochrysis_carterae.AAC.1